MKKQKKDSGITLIALVVTIVVLIILATISVNLVINAKIIDKANKGGQLYKQEEGKEAILMAIVSMKSDTIPKKEELTLDYIGEHIHEKLEIDKEDVTKHGDPTDRVDVIYKGYEYEIDKDLNVTIVGTKEERVDITYEYTRKEEEGIITLTVKTLDEKGIKSITKPDGSVQKYTNQEKEVTIEYKVTENGEYPFTAEGGNGKTRKRIVKVEDFDYFNITFNSANDFLDIEGAYTKSKGSKTAEQNTIISEVGTLVSDNNILYATKIQDNEWTIVGASKTDTLEGWYLYNVYGVNTSTSYTEGTWSSWTKTNILSRYDGRLII